MAKIQTVKIADDVARMQALQVIAQVYQQEKNWLKAVEAEVPAENDPEGRYSWFLATVNGQPAGVLRLFYDPPLELPAEFKVSLRQDIDLKQMAANGRFVEIGRFMILPEYRKKCWWPSASWGPPLKKWWSVITRILLPMCFGVSRIHP
jgi:hypothetical protein